MFTSSTGQHNPMTWGQFSKYSFDLVDDFPTTGLFWYPSTSYLPGKYAYKVAFFLFHYIPAYIVDFIALLTGKEPKFVNQYIIHFKNILPRSLAIYYIADPHLNLLKRYLYTYRTVYEFVGGHIGIFFQIVNPCCGIIHCIRIRIQMGHCAK